MDYTQNSFTVGNVLPKYVTEDTLKRARVDTPDGPAIRVKSLVATPADLTNIENTTEAIKNSSLDIKTTLGSTSDASSANTVIGLLKSIVSKFQ